METISVPEHFCLACNAKIDSVSNTTGDQKPSEGDITICLPCGHIMAFNKDLTVRELTKQELIDIAGNQHLIKVLEIRGQVMKKKA